MQCVYFILYHYICCCDISAIARIAQQIYWNLVSSYLWQEWSYRHNCTQLCERSGSMWLVPTHFSRIATASWHCHVRVHSLVPREGLRKAVSLASVVIISIFCNLFRSGEIITSNSLTCYCFQFAASCFFVRCNLLVIFVAEMLLLLHAKIY